MQSSDATVTNNVPTTTETTTATTATTGADAFTAQQNTVASELLNAAGDMPDELLKGIADILEGYGLLKDGAAAEDALQKAAQLLSSFYNTTLKNADNAASLGADAMYSTDAVSNEAGMLNKNHVNNDAGSSKRAHPRVSLLLGEYRQYI